jgi:hypothetical protein
MKFLFKLIVLPIITILFIPAVFLALTYKSVEIPIEEFEPATETVSLTAMINEEVDAFLADNNQDSIITISLAQKNANQIIALTFREMNPDYALEDTVDENTRDYVIKEQMFGYQGSWVRFQDDIVEIESGLHVFVPNVNFVYKTSILIAFKLEVDTEEVVLTLDKLTIGNLPLAWLFGPVSWGVEQITGTSLSDIINDQLGGWAEFDVAKREVRLSVDELLQEQASEDPQNAALVQMLLRFIKENELLEIGFQEGNFSAELALGKAKDDTPAFMLPAHLRINSEEEFQAILAARATTLLMSTLTLESGQNPYIEFDALTLNRIFDFFLRESQVEPGVLQQVDLFEKYLLTAYVPFITMDEFFYVNIPITITSIEEPTHIFPSIIKIQATPSMDGDDLKITLNALEMGQITLGGEDISLVLSLLGDNEFIEDGAFVIKDFDQQMQQAGMSITDAAVIDSKLRLTVELSQSLPIQEIQDLINGVLDGIANNPEYPQELNDAINDVLDSLLTGEAEDIEAAVSQFIATLDELDDETAEQLLNDLLAELEGQESSFEDLFNSLNE